MKKEKIAVIGAGNAGFAMAADMALAGHEINLYELPKFRNNIDPVIEKGGIEITGAARTGFAKLNKITTDMKEAVEHCKLIMVVTQSLAHEEIAKLLAPHIRPGQSIILMPGSAGALLFGKIFHEEGVSSDVITAEALMLPYGCRKTGPSSINVSRMLGRLGLGSFPGKAIDSIFPLFSELYPSSFKMTNALEVGICNANIILHPAATMLSIARIEYSKGDFYLYKEGFTPSVEKVVFSLDKEIAAILRKLGFAAVSSVAMFEKRYEKTWDDQFNSIMRKLGSKGPFDVNTRYITEDVPIGMVLISDIGKYLKILTPTFDSVIHLCGVMHDKDFRAEGRTLAKLGMAGMKLDEFTNFIENGYA